jgi:hypothetical protein
MMSRVEPEPGRGIVQIVDDEAAMCDVLER